MHPNRISPQPGQESVWDYPRPAVLEDTSKHLKVICNGTVLAETSRGKRVLETSHPPTYYFPPEDIQMDALIETPRVNICEWKGQYKYYDVKVGNQLLKYAAWRYHIPTAGFEPIQDHYAFFANVMDACYVDDEQVMAQAGDFYGGWITANIVGPFKGGPGTWGW